MLVGMLQTWPASARTNPTLSNEELSGVLHSGTQSCLRACADRILAAWARGEAICMGCAAAAELFHELSAVLTAAYGARLFLAREMIWVTCIYGVE